MSNDASAALASDQVFEESPLFYGRWTIEEEKYAEALIEEFRDGNLEEADFEGGPNTLRGFLATKLRCAPKRISKKFESSGYNGRMQYVLKNGTMTKEESARRREQLEGLHQEFEARRRGLPKKPTKRKQAPRNSATSTTTSLLRRSTYSAAGSLNNNLARDATIVANAYRSPSAAADAATASTVPPLNLAGTSGTLIGSLVPGVGGHHLPTVGLAATRASLLASLSGQRPFITDDLLLSSRPLLPGLATAAAAAPVTTTASLLGPSLGVGGSLFQPSRAATTTTATPDSSWLASLLATAPAPDPQRPTSEAALLTSLLSTAPAGTAAAPAPKTNTSLLAKRRLEHDALRSMIETENIMNNQANALALQQQIAQQQRQIQIVEGINAMATAKPEATTHLANNSAAVEGPPSKRPRSA